MSSDKNKGGEKLFRKECLFKIAASNISHFREPDLPEVAFAGRSNVGKSSLLNALTFRKKLARSSNTPGRTQQINFFDLGDDLTLVDLPGYGYASASKEKRHAWGKMIDKYLCKRESLRRVLLLIDARRGLKDVDRETMKMLDQSGVPYTIVLTKTDKVKNEVREKEIANIEEELKNHPAAMPTLFPTSAGKMIGLEELRNYILTID